MVREMARAMDIQAIKAIRDQFTITTKRGPTAVPAGVLLLGFNDFEAVRLPLVELWPRLLELFAGNLRHYSTTHMGRPKKIDTTFEGLIPSWFSDPYREPDDGGEYGVEAHSSEHPEGAGDWGLHFYVQPWELEFEAGVLAIKVPLEQVIDGTLERLTREVARTLPLRSAYAGLTIARNCGYPTNHDEQVAVWCMRYHGLLFDSPVGVQLPLHDGVLTPSWLTVLHPELAAECELGDELAAAGVTVGTEGEATVLRTGELPILADAHGDPAQAQAYRALHRALAPVLFTEAEHIDFEGFDEEMLERWVVRFEET